MEKDNASKEPDHLRLHVGGLDKSAAEADVKKLFAGHTEFVMPLKKQTKQNMGFAFVTFANEADAKKALEKANGKEIKGKKLLVEYAFKRVEKTNLKNAKNEKQVEPAAKKQKAENGAQVNTLFRIKTSIADFN